MKFNNSKAFLKHLQDASKQKLFTGCYLIVAQDSFEKRQALDNALKYLLQDEPNKELALEQFTADGSSIDIALTALQTMSLIVKRRVIVLNDIESLSKNAAEKLENALKKTMPNTTLIATATAFSQSSSLYKKFESLGVILDVPLEKPWEKEKNREEWVVARAQFYGKKLQLRTAKLLVKLVGSSYDALDQELFKLSTFAIDKQEITENDLSCLIARVAEQSVWQLGEAIVNRETKNAFFLFKALLKDGNALLSLLALLRKQFETGFEIASILERGGGTSEISASYPQMKGFILEKNVREAKAYGLAGYQKSLLAVDESILQAKSSQLEPDFLADLLLFKLF